MTYDEKQINEIMQQLVLNDLYIEADELADDAFEIMNPSDDGEETPEVFRSNARDWIKMLIESDYGYREFGNR